MAIPIDGVRRCALALDSIEPRCFMTLLSCASSAAECQTKTRKTDDVAPMHMAKNDGSSPNPSASLEECFGVFQTMTRSIGGSVREAWSVVCREQHKTISNSRVFQQLRECVELGFGNGPAGDPDPRIWTCAVDRDDGHVFA